jgi:hypothetical protein
LPDAGIAHWRAWQKWSSQQDRPATGEKRMKRCFFLLCFGGLLAIFSLTARAAGIDVIADCKAKGDGVADDYQAIQDCIDKNPGTVIFFPKPTAWYHLSKTLVPKGSSSPSSGAGRGGMILRGESTGFRNIA